MASHTSPHDLEGHPLALTHDHNHVDATAKTITRKQLFYILGPHALGAGIIDSIANFALACAMYRTTHKEVRLWHLDKNTIAGDMGITVIVQGILTMLITSSLVRGDVRVGRIEPFPTAWRRWYRKVGTSGWRCYMARVIRFLSSTQTLSLRVGWREFSKSLFIILLRGFVVSAIYFFLVWPPAIAITDSLYGGVDMHGMWTPQVIKAVFGGVLGLTMNPFVAVLVLGAEPPPPPTSMGKVAFITPIPPMTMRQEEVLSVARPLPAYVSPPSSASETFTIL